MDFFIPLPVTQRENTVLLLFQYHFTGFVLVKALSATRATKVAKAFEENIFRHVRAPSLILHDRDPGFISKVFQTFAKIMGSKSRATYHKCTVNENAA